MIITPSFKRAQGKQKYPFIYNYSYFDGLIFHFFIVLIMRKKRPSILIAGDIAIDKVGWSTSPIVDHSDWQTDRPNIARYPGYRINSEPGGALLLSDMITTVLKCNNLVTDIKSYHITDIDSVPASKLLHSTAFLETFPMEGNKQNEKNRVYRIRWFGGYSGSPTSVDSSFHTLPDTDPDLLVLDDAGNYFREKEDFWPSCLKDSTTTFPIILKMSAPLCKGRLFTMLKKKQKDNLFVIISGDDLRKTVVSLSRQLSWERLAEDFMWQIRYNPDIEKIRTLPRLIIRFGVEGAIYYSYDNGISTACLIYDPLSYEGRYKDQFSGGMQGLSDAFTAGFVTKFYQKGVSAVPEAIKYGLSCARSFQKYGFGPSEDEPHYRHTEIFKPAPDHESGYYNISIPDLLSLVAKGHHGSWTILESLKDVEIEETAKTIVRNGWKGHSGKIPIGVFGALSTIDRGEIESFQSIRNLFKEYLSDTNHIKPLSIAVFGPPGSGKSFGVHQLAKSLEQYPIEKIEFNLSQFRDPEDLTVAFHKVRDIVLSGRIPLVFFDEFDTKTHETLGWLRHFLSPMQDGTFRERESVHPIGKAIFVFAGGICQSVNEFQVRKKAGGQEKFDDPEFQNAKGTDFKSRLRGYVNIKGCNNDSPADTIYIIRRAMVLRSLLKEKAGSIFDAHDTARIDPGVLRAFLMIPVFYHGIRSMEAIIDMSMLSGKDSFEQSSLPPQEQIALHTDEVLFRKLVEQESFFGSALEDIAQAIHNQYLETQKQLKKKSKTEAAGSSHDASSPDSEVPWDSLDEPTKESNRAQARDIPSKLKAIRCWYIPDSDKKIRLIKFTESELEKLAQLEHIRYVDEKTRNGWKFGPARDPQRRLNPTIVSWNDLPAEERLKDFQTVARIPQYLAKAGFRVYRLGGRSKKI
jgi:hypothetical protein